MITDDFIGRFFLVVVTSDDIGSALSKMRHGTSSVAYLVRAKAVFVGPVKGGIPDLSPLTLDDLAEIQEFDQLVNLLTPKSEPDKPSVSKIYRLDS